MKFLKWFGRITPEQRARNDIAEHERRLFTANANLALWEHNVRFHDSEIARLSYYITDEESSGGVINMTGVRRM